MTKPPDQAAEEPAFGPATPNDVEALAAIDADSPGPWSAAAFEEEIRRGESVFVLRRGVLAVAFVVLRKVGAEMDLVNLAVRRTERRGGLGLILLRSLLHEAAASGIETAFLEVRESNHAAVKFYLSFGFQEVQRRKAFYRDPVEDAILLRLEINAQNTVESPKKRMLGSSH